MPRFIRPTSLRLPDDSIERHTTWLEIFFDLVFAMIIVQLSDRLTSNFTIAGIFQCSALLIPVLWAWVSYTVFAARFDNNDGIHWAVTFIIMFAGAIMAIQIPTALEDGGNIFAIGFIISQISLLFLYLRPYNDKATPKNMLHLYMGGFGLGVSCWIVSLFFDPPVNFKFWILGMTIYLTTPWVGKRKILSKAPLDTMYIPERFGSFIVIIIGQIIAAVIYGLEKASWHPSSVLTGVMAFALAILAWGQYYRFTQIADYKCTLGSGQPYIYTHIPFIISLMIIGVCAQKYIADAQIQPIVELTLCLSLIVYLVSFFLLQYIAIKKCKVRALVYMGGIISLLILFYSTPLSPMILMSGVVLIFTALFAIQYYLGRHLIQFHDKRGN